MRGARAQKQVDPPPRNAIRHARHRHSAAEPAPIGLNRSFSGAAGWWLYRNSAAARV